MSEWSFLRRVIKEASKNKESKALLKKQFKQARNDVDTMHLMRSEWDPNYEYFNNVNPLYAEDKFTPERLQRSIENHLGFGSGYATNPLIDSYIDHIEPLTSLVTMQMIKKNKKYLKPSAIENSRNKLMGLSYDEAVNALLNDAKYTTMNNAADNDSILRKIFKDRLIQKINNGEIDLSKGFNDMYYKHYIQNPNNTYDDFLYKGVGHNEEPWKYTPPGNKYYENFDRSMEYLKKRNLDESFDVNEAARDILEEKAAKEGRRLNGEFKLERPDGSGW